ncbi:MAG: ABC transporter permease [Oscillospiraceae bacterium]|jgi:ribose/xylose/arabinose/galactoside ABC-type transport system permease subunit|nr:ABC transporter permease [Oscillospiraceae bacterium]
MSNKGVSGFLKSKLFLLLVIWVGLVVIFTVWAILIGESFFSAQTFVDIGDLLILSSFLAVGAGFLMVSGHLDFSASSIGAFAGVLMAAAMKYWGFPSAVAIIAAIIASVLLGALNGVFVNEFKFPSFIATLAMASVIRGFSYWISVEPGKITPGPVGFRNDVTKFIADGKLFGIPYMLIIAIAVFIVYGLLLAKTKFGMQVYMVGGNPQAARLSGISPRRMYYTLYANSGFLAGIAGVIFMGRVGQGRPDALLDKQFIGLTAAILGGVSFGGGSGNMAGVFVGLLILNTFNKGTTIVRFSTYWTTVFTGLLLLIALTLDYLSARSARKSVGLIRSGNRRKNNPVPGGK